MRRTDMVLSRQQQSWLLIFAFSVITFLLYGNTVYAKFAGDFYGWVNRFQQYGAGGFFEGFGSTSSLYVYHGLLFGLYNLFSLHSWPWFILFAGLHVLNGFLLFRLARQLLVRFQIRHPWIIAFAAALFFLVSPKQNEPVVWGAALHYLVCSGLVLFILLAILRHEKTKSKKYYVAGLFAGLVAVYTTEIAQAIPLVMVLFYLMVYFRNTSLSFTGFAGRWVVPQLLFGGSFFAANYLRMGDWVGHYGAEVHLQFSIITIIGNAATYFADYLLFLKQLHYRVVHWVHELFLTPWIAWLLLVLGSGLIILIVVRLPRLSGSTRMLLFSAGSFLLLLGPVLNLYYFHLLTGMNDLYGYPASPFIYLALAISLFRIFPRNVAMTLGGAYLVVALLLSNFGTIRWQESGILRNGLMSSYEKYEGEKTVLLNVPNTVKGAYAFKNEDVFAMSYKVTRGHDIKDKIWEISWYNMKALTNGVTVERVDSNQLRVRFKHFGSWWWKRGFGATDYETDHYRVNFDQWGGYLLTFTDSLYESRTILYQDGISWQQFDL